MMAHSVPPLFSHIETLQGSMEVQGVDGWLFYDFRCSNAPMLAMLGMSRESHLTRRLFYWLPAKGQPTLLRHAVDAAGVRELETLQASYGQTLVFSSWQQLHLELKKLVGACKKVAMEISQECAIPYLSCVDGGTVQLIESLGPQVVPSDFLLSQILGRFDQKGLESHLAAARALDEESLALMAWIHSKLARSERIYEYQASLHLKGQLQARGMWLESNPTIAVGPNSADPHYSPYESGSRRIEPDQVLLIDVWCKKNQPMARWADICRMAFIGSMPSQKHQEVFNQVLEAQQAAIDFLQVKLASGQRVEGREADRAARNVITEKGYGPYFTHRLGHNIDLTNHGNGTHLDDFETQDKRELMTRSCFSIEPGIYLPGDFGVRLESDGYIDSSRRLHITGGRQLAWYCLDPSASLKLPMATSPNQIAL